MEITRVREIYYTCCGKVVAHRSRACKITQHPEYYTSGCCGATVKVIQNF